VTGPESVKIRDVARAAVRAQLAEVAFDLFLRDGFEAVTISDIASAAGVSRSTVLRYFGTKEEAVLGTVDLRGGVVADALRERPLDEDDWTALRRAMDVAIEPYHRDHERALALTRLIQETPALRTRLLEKQTSWQPLLAQALAERGSPSKAPAVSDWVWASAAVGCMNVAVGHWSASNGHIDLAGLVDEAFAALATPPENGARLSK